VSRLPFEKTRLKPYTNYTWTVMYVYDNIAIYTGTVRTLEDGKLKSYLLIF
jgi:hypothetical protein